MKHLLTLAFIALNCVLGFSQQKNSKVEYTTKDTPFCKPKNQHIDNGQTPNWEMQKFFLLDENLERAGTYGMAVEGDYYYSFMKMGNWVQIIDLEGNHIAWGQGLPPTCDVTNDGTYFYMGATYSKEIYVLAHNGGYPNEMIFEDPIPVDFLNTFGVTCVTFDNTTNSLWIAGGTGDNGSSTDIFNIDLEGNILDTIEVAPLSLNNMMGLAYYNDGSNPALWISQLNGMLSKLDINTEQITIQKDMGYLCNEFSGHGGLFSHQDMYEPGTTTIGGLAFENYVYAYNAETMFYSSADAGANTLTDPTYAVALNSTVSGTIKNYSPTALTNVDVSWNINDGEVTTETIDLSSSPLNQFDEYEFSLTEQMNIDPSLLGTEVTFKIWTSQPNGGVDDDNFNDTLAKPIFIGTGISGDKKILFEPWLVYGDDWWDMGWSWMNNIINNPDNAEQFTVANMHRWGSEWDEFGILETNLIVQDHNNGSPRISIDRFKFPGQWISVGAFSYGGESLLALLENYKKYGSNAMYTPCNIEFEGEIDTANNLLNISVNTVFVDYALASDYRISLYIIEDNAGDIEENDYTLRAALPVEDVNGEKVYNWGLAGIIPNSPQAGETYTAEFNDIELNPTWKMEDLRVIGFVSHYNEDPTKRNLLNSNWEYVNNFPTPPPPPPSGIYNVNTNKVRVYPVPTKNELHLESENTMVKAEITNITGDISRVYNIDLKKSLTINTKDLAPGLYLVKVTSSNNEVYFKKIIKTK